MNSKNRITLPKSGLGRDELFKTMQARRSKDAEWQTGKAFCLVYHPGEERSRMIKEAYNMFFTENALNPTAFPSLRQFEAEVVSMSAGLLRGDEKVAGSLTSGGTESILLAVKTARSWASKHKPGVAMPEVIIPETAHPAFHKAFYYFGVKGVMVPVREDFRVDVQKVKEAITENTVMIVGSAPSYPHGVIDPIRELSNLALENKLLMHVDSCVGGFLLPFIQKLGYPVVPFDFSLEGVTSISADIHKYGYAAKGASVILYRNAELRKHQFYVYTDWCGGIYGSPTISGTRPGGTIAAAWAALMSIGEEGYLEMAKRTMVATERIKQGIKDMKGVHVLGNPDMSLIAFGSEEHDIYAIGDELNMQGWYFDRQQNPASLHLTVSQIHLEVVDTFLEDLERAIKQSAKFRVGKLGNSFQVATVKGLSKMLPEGMIAKLQNAMSSTKQVTKKRTAAMYGMMGALSGTGDLQAIVLNFLDRLNSLEQA